MTITVGCIVTTEGILSSLLDDGKTVVLELELACRSTCVSILDMLLGVALNVKVLGVALNVKVLGIALNTGVEDVDSLEKRGCVWLGIIIEWFFLFFLFFFFFNSSNNLLYFNVYALSDI